MPKPETADEDLKRVRMLTQNGWSPEDFRKAQASLVSSIFGNKELEEIFTSERTKELGFSESMRTRFLITMQRDDRHVRAIRTIKELVAYRKDELLKRPNFGIKRLKYAEAVLKTINIRFRI